MIVVVDANVLISALMGSRVKLSILTAQNHSFYVPSKIVEEIKKYKTHICTKVSQTSEEFEQNAAALLMFIDVLEQASYISFIQRASEVMNKRDSTDSEYLACALAVNADLIWTDDKDFRVQKLVKTRNTSEFIELNKKA